MEQIDEAIEILMLGLFGGVEVVERRLLTPHLLVDGVEFLQRRLRAQPGGSLQLLGVDGACEAAGAELTARCALVAR